MCAWVGGLCYHKLKDIQRQTLPLARPNHFVTHTLNETESVAAHKLPIAVPDLELKFEIEGRGL